MIKPMINRQRIGVGLVLVALWSLPGMSGCSTKISDRAVARISTSDAGNRHGRGQALFIDARPAPDFDRGHIAGAVNLRLGDLSYTQRDPRLTGRSPLIVYGENPGSASALALAKRMLDLEYEGVEYFEPGYQGWRGAGLPVEGPGD
jgi:rhodanese-related sulfurtransferase